MDDIENDENVRTPFQYIICSGRMKNVFPQSAVLFLFQYIICSGRINPFCFLLLFLLVISIHHMFRSNERCLSMSCNLTSISIHHMFRSNDKVSEGSASFNSFQYIICSGRINFCFWYLKKQFPISIHHMFRSNLLISVSNYINLTNFNTSYVPVE